jgi:hypothetical protein
LRETRWWILLAALVAVLIVWVSLMVVTPALAAGDGERVGENVGKLLGGWAKSLYVGITAIVAVRRGGTARQSGRVASVTPTSRPRSGWWRRARRCVRPAPRSVRHIRRSCDGCERRAEDAGGFRGYSGVARVHHGSAEIMRLAACS